MGYVVEVERGFRAVQGLASPVRESRGLPLISATEGVVVVVSLGVAFREEQLAERGWFFDTDAAAAELERCCAGLDERPWTEIFDFRPTFELVARHLYGELAPRVPQLTFVAIRDSTLGVVTRYSPT